MGGGGGGSVEDLSPDCADGGQGRHQQPNRLLVVTTIINYMSTCVFVWSTHSTISLFKLFTLKLAHKVFCKSQP